MYDLVIRNGKIVDGTGNPWFQGDLAVRGDRIVDVGRVPRDQAEQEIDGAGRVVAPGFIDIHTHSEIPLVVDPKAESKVRQGVTTEVVGNCGGSAAPLVGAALDQMKHRLSLYDPPMELDWATMEEYLAKLLISKSTRGRSCACEGN